MRPAAAPSTRPEPPSAPTAPLARHVGQRIRERRIALGLSLQELSTAVGLTPAELGKCESGLDYVPVTCVGNLAIALAISTQWLFDSAEQTLSDAPVATPRDLPVDQLVSLETTPGHQHELTKMAQALATQAATSKVGTDSSWTAEQTLMPADPAHVAAAITHALHSNFGKRTSKADNVMASAVAKRLVEHLQACGFVLMRQPAVAANSAGPDGG